MCLEESQYFEGNRNCDLFLNLLKMVFTPWSGGRKYSLRGRKDCEIGISWGDKTRPCWDYYGNSKMWSKNACRRICNRQNKHEVLGHYWSTMKRDHNSCTMNAKFKGVKTYGACMLWARARQKFQADNDSSLWTSIAPLRGGDSFICQYYKGKSHPFQKKRLYITAQCQKFAVFSKIMHHTIVQQRLPKEKKKKKK